MNVRAISLSVLSCLFWVVVGPTPAASQKTPKLDAALAALQNDNTSNGATLFLLDHGKEDPLVKKYLAEHLPKILSQYQERADGMPNYIWGNEARVAGEFQIVEAVPVLARRIDMLTSDRMGGGQGYNFFDHAANNALINIGPLAVPAVIDVLKHGNRLQREMAAHVLREIGSDAAWHALEEALPGEKDPNVRHRIQEAIDSRR
jgi:HEAT repeat protein